MRGAMETHIKTTHERSNFLNRLARLIVERVSPVTNPTSERPYRLYNYLKSDGSFDYELYRSIQRAGNRRKIDRVWALEENIEFLSRYIRRRVGTTKFGICHGT